MFRWIWLTGPVTLVLFRAWLDSIYTRRNHHKDSASCPLSPYPQAGAFIVFVCCQVATQPCADTCPSSPAHRAQKHQIGSTWTRGTFGMEGAPARAAARDTVSCEPRVGIHHHALGTQSQRTTYICDVPQTRIHTVRSCNIRTRTR